MTGAVQNTCGQPRVFNTQAKARDTPIALVACGTCGRSLTPRVACVWSQLLRGSTFLHSLALIHWLVQPDEAMSSSRGDARQSQRFIRSTQQSQRSLSGNVNVNTLTIHMASGTVTGTGRGTGRVHEDWGGAAPCGCAAAGGGGGGGWWVPLVAGGAWWRRRGGVRGGSGPGPGRRRWRGGGRWCAGVAACWGRW
jgi:hypothetical protein